MQFIPVALWGVHKLLIGFLYTNIQCFRSKFQCIHSNAKFSSRKSARAKDTQASPWPRSNYNSNKSQAEGPESCPTGGTVGQEQRALPLWTARRERGKETMVKQPCTSLEERREGDWMSHREFSDKVEKTTRSARVVEEASVFMVRESWTDSPETGQTAQLTGQASRHLGVNHWRTMGLCQAIWT